MTEDVRDTVAGDAADAALPVDDSATPIAGDDTEVPVPAVEVDSAPAPEVINFQDRWLRTEADLQNFRRRAVRDREESVTRAEESLLLDVIGLLDDLERALAAMSPEQLGEPWALGVTLTAQRMRDMLGRHGVTPIVALGTPFDPSVHEALLEIEAPEGVQPGCVAQEALKGYRRGERALRAARVVVARAETER